METTSFHGNRIPFSIAALLALTICTLAASYSLKKSAQMKYWDKVLSAYSRQLEQENQLAKSNANPRYMETQ